MKILRRILNAAGSIELTLVNMSAMLLLVFIATLAQVNMGAFAAQKIYFNSFWIHWSPAEGLRIPIFPGGLLVGASWGINLVATYFYRKRFSRRLIGTYITHVGLMGLIFGQFLTQVMAKESQMPIEEGATRNYAESFRDTELVVIDTSHPEYDSVTSFPQSRFSRLGRIDDGGLPFTIAVAAFYHNARLTMRPADASEPPPASHGVGASIRIEGIPAVMSDDEMNNVSAVVDLADGKGNALGRWLLSSALEAPQSLFLEGREYRLSIRPLRRYYPFSLTLKDFRHDLYPGTDIPKNFSSLVRLTDPRKNEDRDVLIYMNHPLRYDGKTFYQASFGKENTLSVFQVVENPFWLSPYIGCILVALGLAIQFLTSLAAFAKRRPA